MVCKHLFAEFCKVRSQQTKSSKILHILWHCAFVFISNLSFKLVDVPKDYERRKKRKFYGNRYGGKHSIKVARIDVSTKSTCFDEASISASSSTEMLRMSALTRKIGGHNIRGK